MLKVLDYSIQDILLVSFVDITKAKLVIARAVIARDKNWVGHFGRKLGHKCFTNPGFTVDFSYSNFIKGFRRRKQNSLRSCLWFCANSFYLLYFFFRRVVIFFFLH